MISSSEDKGIIYRQDNVKKKRYGDYEFMLVPFRLSNAPIIFMCLMNGVFREYQDKFVIIFLDDIIIYSKSKESMRSI
jgi:hypothetical protein